MSNNDDKMTRRVVFWLIGFAVVYCAHCFTDEEFNLIKEENEDLKAELRQMKIRMNRMENMTSQLHDDVKALKRSEADVVKRVADLETTVTGTVSIFFQCAKDQEVRKIATKMSIFVKLSSKENILSGKCKSP